jgi:hypothetical protein
MFPPDCTLVTACFDVSKYNNSINKPYYLVIFTDNICLQRIKLFY